MNRIITIVAGLIIFLVTGCSGRYAAKDLAYIDEDEREDYAIYSAGIRYVYPRNLLANNRNELKSIVIISRTNELNDYWRKEFIGSLKDKGIPKEVIEDWWKNNETAITLERKFDFAYDYVLVTRAELDKYKPETFFTEFYKKYPDSNGLISVSRIGFDKAKNRALIHVIHNYGSLGANYNFLFMEKTQDGWTVAQRISTGGS